MLMLDGHNLCYLKLFLGFDNVFIELGGMFLKPPEAYKNYKILFFRDKTLLIENRFWIKGTRLASLKVAAVPVAFHKVSPPHNYRHPKIKFIIQKYYIQLRWFRFPSHHTMFVVLS